MGSPAAMKPAAVVVTTNADSLALARSLYALMREDTDVAVVAAAAVLVVVLVVVVVVVALLVEANDVTTPPPRLCRITSRRVGLLVDATIQGGIPCVPFRSVSMGDGWIGRLYTDSTSATIL